MSDIHLLIVKVMLRKLLIAKLLTETPIFIHNFVIWVH
jgi:hypothetical protein